MIFKDMRQNEIKNRASINIKSYKDCLLNFQTLINRNEGNEPAKETEKVSSWKTKDKTLVSWKSS